jgi:hypothetical protein
MQLISIEIGNAEIFITLLRVRASKTNYVIETDIYYKEMQYKFRTFVLVCY